MQPSSASTLDQAPAAPKSFFRRISLSQWIVISMIVGILLGWAFPDNARDVHRGWAATDLNVLSSVFLRMIKSLIVPLLFATLVVGIAGHGDDMKRVGRLALRSIIYFEIVTTVALVVGLLAVNLVKPGVGVDLGAASAKEGADLATAHTTLTGVIEHTVPQSFFDAASKNEVLQIVFFAIIFAVALSKVQGPSKTFHALRFRGVVRGDVQVRRHRDGLRADRYRRGDRGHGFEGRTRHPQESRHSG
jgi:proton glutamate symport protein